MTLNDLTLRPNASHAPLAVTLRDLAMPVFRQRRLALLVFLGVFLGAILSALLLPRNFEAEMKILVNRDRVDTVVTPDPNAAEVVAPVPVVSDEDINSEVELIKSRDLLEQVVKAYRLDARPSSAWGRSVETVSNYFRGVQPTPEARLAQSVQDLDSRLIVEPLKKTTLIRVTYASHDPQQSARVLQTLGSFYGEKHAAVHRPAGAFSFFDQQVIQYRDQLAAAETQLTDFDARENVVAPAAQKQLVLEQLSQFEAELQQDQSGASAAGAKVQALRAASLADPQRQTTQIRTLDNAQLLAQLESTLLSLELKRRDMLAKYAPSYPPVLELEDQIEDARSAIALARRAPLEDVTTDRAPAQDWMATELAKAQSDRIQLKAHAQETSRAVQRYQEIAQQLDRKGTEQDDLIRGVKTAEDNYLLYLRKREEARISDALDSKRIVNVSIAEAATVPALSTLRFGWLLIGSFFAAGLLSVGTAYTVDRLDPSFRTPDELSRYLDIKVLASIPAGTARLR